MSVTDALLHNTQQTVNLDHWSQKKATNRNCKKIYDEQPQTPLIFPFY